MTDTDNKNDLSMYTVLVVDDIPVNIVLLQTMLSRINVKITSAKNGQDALDSISKSKPKLVLLDIQMPVMDGFETLRRIKADPETKDIHVVMVSAFTAPDEVQKAMELGASGYITKPILMDDLISCVTAQLLDKEQ